MKRTSKRWLVALCSVLTVALSVGAIAGAVWVTHTQTAQVENGKRRCESKKPVQHTVVIQNGQVQPKSTLAAKCDTLTITNRDPQVRLMAFGRHEDHISYDGISEQRVGQNQSLSVTLIKTGTYIFHDHTDDVVSGTFTVR